LVLDVLAFCVDLCSLAYFAALLVLGFSGIALCLGGVIQKPGGFVVYFLLVCVDAGWLLVGVGYFRI